jgi:transposase
MKTNLSKKQLWLNKIKLTEDDALYVGIDVHKKSYAVALWLNDAPAFDFVMPADNHKVLSMLSELRIALKKVVYEAGPTGYSLARLLRQNTLPIEVIAPSKTPRQSAPDSKTDRLDCRKLAEYAAKGLLKSITTPSMQQEAERQLSRIREQIVDKQRKVKLQIKGFLLQHGISEPAGLASWSIKAVEQLSQINLSKHLRYCLDCLLQQLHFLKAQLKTTEQQLNQIFTQRPLSTKLKILTTHPGIGPVTARQFATEIFNPRRFKDKTEIAKYVGLAPMVTQSGESLRDGPITKTGRPQLRANLIEASWAWIRKDAHAYKTYVRLLHNTGHKNKAITAMARRLAIHLWRMSSDNKPYIQPA